MAHRSEPMYVRLAENLSQQVTQGTLRPGDRVPSLRQFSRERRVSMSTALETYLLLENRGFLEARPQSGFYVRTPFANLIPEPRFEQAAPRPVSSTNHQVVADMLQLASDPQAVPFGAGHVSPELLPVRRLNLVLRRIVAKNATHSSRYEFPPGNEALRRQIARRAPEFGCSFTPRDVVITSGTLDGVTVALRAVTRPGDAVAVESPTYFGILGSAGSLGLKMIEIPTHPQNGMDLDALECAIRKHRVKACVSVPNCHNPLGYVLPDSYKRDLVELTNKRNVALIEDDIYADLAFRGPRPRVLQAFDKKGLVLLCSSFSKSLAPGFRVGWIMPGRFRAEVEELKFLSTVAAASLPQLVIAEFLASGAYMRHLKALRAKLQPQMEITRQGVAKYFPEGTRISLPAGGHMLWVELPPRTDALKLYRAAVEQKISVLPGTFFSASGRFRNYIRINGGHVWTDAQDRALLTLGRLCEKLAGSLSAAAAASSRAN
jgi:DNA-binding transcriptional MocR family regulator